MKIVAHERAARAVVGLRDGGRPRVDALAIGGQLSHALDGAHDRLHGCAGRPFGRNTGASRTDAAAFRYRRRRNAGSPDSACKRGAEQPPRPASRSGNGGCSARRLPARSTAERYRQRAQATSAFREALAQAFVAVVELARGEPEAKEVAFLFRFGEIFVFGAAVEDGGVLQELDVAGFEVHRQVERAGSLAISSIRSSISICAFVKRGTSDIAGRRGCTSRCRTCARGRSRRRRSAFSCRAFRRADIRRRGPR